MHSTIGHRGSFVTEAGDPSSGYPGPGDVALAGVGTATVPPDDPRRYASVALDPYPGGRPWDEPWDEPLPDGAAPAQPPTGPPTVAPPGPRRRGRDPLWARVTVVVGALLMVLSGGAVVGAKVLIGRYTGTIEQTSLLGDSGAPRHTSITGPLNILLVGVDQRPDNPGDLIRSDSIIIVHVPAAHDQAYLVSIPRDLLVDIPPDPRSGYRGGKDKINSAFAFGSQGTAGRAGGFALLARTIKQLTGITFNAAAIVDFGGFQALVQALGGVDMCIDERVVSHHIGFDRYHRFLPPDRGGKPMVYEPGCRHLPPWQALDYVRQRYGLPNGDYDRQRHQQQFLKAVLKEAKKQGVATNPVKLFQVMSAAGKALTVDTNGASVEDWLYTLSGVVNGEPVMLKTNAGKVNSTTFNGESCEQLTPDSMAMFEAVRDDKLADFVGVHPDFVSTDVG